jgi:hypothetical protein
MGILKTIIFAVLTALVPILSKVLADEFKAWSPLVARILEVAVRALPPSRRDRYSEEWKAHVIEKPGDLGKFFLSCGCVWAS